MNPESILRERNDLQYKIKELTKNLETISTNPIQSIVKKIGQLEL